MTLPEPASPLNALPELSVDRQLPRELLISDVALREGEQMEGVSFELETKVELARELERVGVSQVQVGYPGRFERDANAVAAVAEALSRARVEAVALAFVTDWEQEIDACLASGADVVNVVYRSSARLQALLGVDAAAAAARVEAAVSRAVAGGATVAFTPSDSTRADVDHLVELWRVAAAAGATRVYVADSMGAATPELVAWLVARARQATELPIGVHCHNDLGLVVANSVAGVLAGADVVDVAVNGLGDRTGNCPLEEMAVAFALGYNIDTGIELGRLTSLSRRFAAASGRPVPANKPVTGPRTFAHVLPTHVEVMRRDSRAIQPYEPEIVGNTGRVGETSHASGSDD